METNLSRQQFYKTSYYNIGDPRKKGLLEAFDLFHVAEFRDGLERLKNMALCADQSVYDDCVQRENMLLFTKELTRLIEAFYLLIREKHQNQLKRELTKPVMKVVKKHYKPIYLTPNEQHNPEKLIQSFAQTFKKAYARSELLDMLDAAISYEGSLSSYKGTLVFLYRQLDFMVRLSYVM